MHGFLQRHPTLATRVFLAGAALLAGAAAPLHAQLAGPGAGSAPPPEETAMAVQRLPLAPGGGGGIVVLPHPLDAGSAARVRRIFALQRGGDILAAALETARLEDGTLLGDLLADRYLGAGAKPGAAQLRSWLKSYADLPDAPAIHQDLAGISHGVLAVPAPSPGAALGTASPAAPLPEEADPAERAFTRNALLDRTVAERSALGPAGAASALRLIAASRRIDPLYASQLRAEVAQRLFTGGSNDLALATAETAFDDSGRRLGIAGYVAGLAAWRAGRPDAAGLLFEAASRARLTSAGTRAGAAFWAARAHLRADDPGGYQPWLARAAAAPHTFYGLLAARLLGRPDESWDRSWNRQNQAVELGTPFDAAPGAGRASLSEIDVEAVAALPAGRRALALLQVGEAARAEATLRRFWPEAQADMALCRSIQLVAEAAGLTALSAQLDGILQSRAGQPHGMAPDPIPRLVPRHGFTVNPALVYALTRLESSFDPEAVSDAGAHGLMQLMPATAGFILGHPDRFAGNPQALHNPALNLELGQRYLSYLAAQPSVRNDLVRLLASYNAGPTAVARWNGGETDPLLFIESIPLDETRDYVHRAFTYLWVYARRMSLPSPSLAALAAGDWPRFADEQKVMVR